METDMKGEEMNTDETVANRITAREKMVLNLVAKGEHNSQIAEHLFISSHTAKIHLKNIFQKLEAKDRTDAVVKAIKLKIIDV